MTLVSIDGPSLAIFDTGENTAEATRQAAIATAAAAAVDADVTAAVAARDAADNFYNAILNLVANNVFATKAAGDAALATIAANDFALIEADETHSGEMAIYRKISGALSYRFSLNRIGGLRAAGTPRLGRGVSIGAPTGTPTAIASGTGLLTGTYKYAYSESDGVGITPLSPQASVTVTSKQVLVTLPQPRRGTSQRYLYRTQAGGSTFYLLKALDGGSQYFQTEFLDNLPDGSLGAVRSNPTQDTSELWAMELQNGVKTFRTHPDQGASPADLTVLTGDSGYTTGAYAMDVYGEVLVRTHRGNAFASEKAGTFGSHFAAYYLGPRVESDTPQLVTEITPRGSLQLVRFGALSDPSALDGNGAVLRVTGTHGAANTVSAAAIDLTATGAGSAAFDQFGARFALVAGYAGTARSVGSTSSNASANSGEAVGAEGRATGAASLSIGVKGVVTAGAKQAAVVGMVEDFAASALSWPAGVNQAGGLFSNGTSVGDIIQGYDNTSIVFRVTNGGAVEASNVGANQTFDIFGSGGGGRLRLETNGGTYVAVGSTNNVDFRLRANATDVASITTRQTLNLPDRGADPASPEDGDIWRNGSSLKVRLGGVTKTITVA